PEDPAYYALGGGDRARVLEVFDDLAFGDTIRRDLPASLLGESVSVAAAAEEQQVSEVLMIEDVAGLQELLDTGGDILALDVVEDVRGGALLGLATPDARGAVQLERLDSEASSLLASALDRATEILVADAPAVRSWLGERGYRPQAQLHDLSLASFVLRPGARTYDAAALGTEFAGVSFEPRPRKPAPSTLAKEAPEVRAEHVARAAARLAGAAAALHPAAEVLGENLAQEPWALRILDELERPLQAVLETMHERGIA